MEWSVDIHTPDLAVSRSWEFACNINVKDGPFLVVLIVFVFSYYLSVLMIKFALNCKDLSLLVHEVFINIGPELIPSRVGLISVSIASSDINGKVLEFNRSDSL